MSEKIRQGNDIRISWSLIDEDEHPYNLDGRNIAIELHTGKKKVRIKEHSISGNTVYFTYYGKDQKYIGSYNLVFIENDGQVDMVTFDTKDAFTLVEHSWLAIDEGETPETIQLEFVTITSELTERIGPPGAAAGFGTVDAEVDDTLGPPSVDVETSGPNTAKNIHFSFHGLTPEMKKLAGQPLTGSGDIVKSLTLGGSSNYILFNVQGVHASILISASNVFYLLHTNSADRGVTTYAFGTNADIIATGAKVYQRYGVGLVFYIPTVYPTEIKFITLISDGSISEREITATAISSLPSGYMECAIDTAVSKNYVDDSIATSSATFLGTSATGLSKAQFLAWADTLNADLNDYCYWDTVDSVGNQIYKRYKYDGSQWLFEYSVSVNEFSVEQMAAINSGIDAEKVAQISKKVSVAVTSNSPMLQFYPNAPFVAIISSNTSALALVEFDGTNPHIYDFRGNVIKAGKRAPTFGIELPNGNYYVAFLTGGNASNVYTDNNRYSGSELFDVVTMYVKPSTGIPPSDIADNAIKTFSGIPIKGTGDIVVKIQRGLAHGGFVVKNAMTGGCVLLLVSENSSKFALFIGGANLNLIVVGGTAEDYFITDNRTDVYINVFDHNFSILLLSGSMPQIEVPDTKPTLFANLTAKSIQDTSSFVTTSVNNLVNYYTKSETYTRSEVATQIANALTGAFVSTNRLPSASANTMGKIYLVPSSDPQTENVKDEYITIAGGLAVSPTYSWEKIGNTAVSLDGVVKFDESQSLTDAQQTQARANIGAGTYTKPSTGIPASDLEEGVIPETIESAEVSVDANTGTPSASASVSGGVLSLEFHNLKGETGATGATGEPGPQGPQGPQGNTGSSVDYPYELVNNLTTDDATKGLSAAQGKVLQDEVSQLGQELVLDVSGLIDLGKWEVGSIGYSNGAIVSTASTSRIRMAQKTITKEGDYKLTCASGFEFAILIVGKITTFSWVSTFERHLLVGDVYRIALRQSPVGDYTGYTQAQVDALVESSQITFKTYGLATEPEVDAKLDKETFDLKFASPLSLAATIQGFVGNNGLIYNNSGYFRTDYISLHGYDRIFARAIIYNVGCDIAFFDANKAFLPAISVVGTGGTHTYEIDLSGVAYKDARYVIISTMNESWNMLKLFSYDSLSNDMMLMPANNHINMLIFGDSITHAANIYLDENNCTSTYAWDTGATAKPWAQIVRDYLQAYDVRDYAKHGATYVDLGAELLSVSNQIQVAINDLSNPNNVFPSQGTFAPDIVIFALGTNDGAPTDTYEEAMAKTIFDQSGNVDIDATLANLDRTKLYQALRYAYLRAKYTWPYAMMMVVLPIQRAGNANNYVVGAIHDAIKQMANRHSIKVIDGAFDMGVCTDLEKNSAEGALLFDGLHPNAKGKNVYARMMLNAIKSNYVNLSNMNPIG